MCPRSLSVHVLGCYSLARDVIRLLYRSLIPSYGAIYQFQFYARRCGFLSLFTYAFYAILWVLWPFCLIYTNKYIRPYNSSISWASLNALENTLHVWRVSITRSSAASCAGFRRRPKRTKNMKENTASGSMRVQPCRLPEASSSPGREILYTRRGACSKIFRRHVLDFGAARGAGRTPGALVGSN